MAVASLILLGGACSSGSHTTTRATGRSLAAQGVPGTYQAACDTEGNCPGRESGSVPVSLIRPLRFPVLRRGAPCPTTFGERLISPDFAGIALGNGPVRVRIDNAGNLLRGSVGLGDTSFPGWHAFKTHWLSVPSYQGPILVRAKRLDRVGRISLGDAPNQAAPLVVPPGPSLNDSSGWRDVPYPTWVKTPGCYGWQIDGRTFTEIVIIRGVPLSQALPR